MHISRLFCKETPETMFNNPISDIWRFVSELLEKIKLLSLNNDALTKENKELRAKLSAYEHPKTSLNSSLPPSKDTLSVQGEKAAKLKMTCSLRPKSDKPSGGQVGHKGITLAVREFADEVITLHPDYCNHCGGSLADIAVEKSETRQVVDIPLPVKPIITNYVSLSKRCTCGHCTAPEFPRHVTNGVSYGSNVQALVAYLSCCQHIPFKRLGQVLNNFYGIQLGEGTISNILNRMRKKAEPAYQAIRHKIEKSPVVGADETGSKVNGELQWMWTFQNKLVTYIFRDPSRGKAAIDKHFPDGFPSSILVTDRHASYFNLQTAGHQICLAHLLRNLTFLDELDPEQDWTKRMLNLLRDGIQQRKHTAFNCADYQHFKDRFDNLMQEDLNECDQKFQTLQKSLVKHQNHLFTFLQNPDVPPDNNASERTIRPLKVKQKVSGMFQSDEGGDNFATLYSIAHTAQKNGQNPFNAFVAVAKYG